MAHARKPRNIYRSAATKNPTRSLEAASLLGVYPAGGNFLRWKFRGTLSSLNLASNLRICRITDGSAPADFFQTQGASEPPTGRAIERIDVPAGEVWIKCQYSTTPDTSFYMGCFKVFDEDATTFIGPVTPDELLKYIVPL